MNIITNIGNEFYKEPSLLNASAIAQSKRKRGLYNFKKLPPAAILIHKNVLSRTQLMLKPVLKGLEGNHYRLNKHYMLSTGFGNGAPAIVSLMEELRALGVRSFIFAGFAGSLLPEVKTGEAYFVKEAIASVGCAAFYSPQQKIKESANLIHYHLIEMLQLKETVCCSTDAPYRETTSLIDNYRQQGAMHVDMECAAIYAFSQFYNIKAMCILLTADSFNDNKWQMPSNVKQLHHQLKQIVLDILSVKYE
ncbi:MAG TPA: hypothetical protein PKN75_02190 [Bacteroidia bacterium]|nr:hypothetical protein [Bacteroidia bacterium]HNU32384.1 hypothetical protein [Bacteroidia bacterium]